MPAKDFTEVQAQYKKLFGKEPISTNKIYLQRRIAFYKQEMEFGGLSAQAKERLSQLIEKHDPVNNAALRPENQTSLGKKHFKRHDRRIPIPGSVITKKYKGQTIMVKVLENGFEYNGTIYNSLSSVASAIAGIHWNGYTFFRL
jgi:hypothetical protein